MSLSSLLSMDSEDFTYWPFIALSLSVTSCIAEFISAQVAVKEAIVFFVSNPCL